MPPPLSFDGYPIPRFAKYSDYFSTSVGSSTNAGRGIADYSNRRFLTQTKNLGHPDFTLPASSPSAYAACKKSDGTDVTVTKWDGSPLAGDARVSLLCAATVQDEYDPSKSATNVALTSRVEVPLPESAFARMSTFTAEERVAKPIDGFSFAN